MIEFGNIYKIKHVYGLENNDHLVPDCLLNSTYVAQHLTGTVYSAVFAASGSCSELKLCRANHE